MQYPEAERAERAAARPEGGGGPDARPREGLRLEGQRTASPSGERVRQHDVRLGVSLLEAPLLAVAVAEEVQERLAREGLGTEHAGPGPRTRGQQLEGHDRVHRGLPHDGLGDEFIDVLKTLHKLGLDRTEKVRVGHHEVSPRDVVAACLPDPLTLGDKMTGSTCAGLLVTGTGTDAQPREVYLYHVARNEWTMQEYGAQAVVWQTAMNPVVALELLATGVWSGAGVLGPEAFDAVPFLDLLRDGYGQTWGLQERDPQTHQVLSDSLA